MTQILEFIAPYWKKGLVPVLYLFFSTVISFVYPLFPKWAIDNVLIKKKHEELLILVISFFLLIVLQRVFTYLNEVTFFKFQKNSILGIQKNLLKKLFYYPMEFFDKNHSGYLMGRIRGDVAGLSYIFSEGLMMVLMDFIKFIVVFIILLLINVKIALISICILPFLLFKIFNSKSHIRTINKKILEENAKLEKELSDTLQGVEVLKSFSKEEEGIKRTETILSDYQEIEVKRNEVFSKYRNIVNLIVHLGEVLLLYFGIKEVISGNFTIGSYIAFSGYLLYLYSPIQNLGNVSIFLDYAKQSYQRIKELLDILPEDKGLMILDEIEKIEIKDLSFSYNGKEKIIRNLNFTINKGEKVLIEGESGSGKSTIIKLLLGLYRPQKGVVRYNGNNFEEINLKKLREKVGYISQNVFLFNKTIKENLIFENKNISDRQLVKLLKECKLKRRIDSIEKGLNHVILEKGVNFSGGEKQRIALARALVKNPEVIIIDEGTSNLDIETEEEILKIIEEKFKDKIIIRVTHREVVEKGWKKISIS